MNFLTIISIYKEILSIKVMKRIVAIAGFESFNANLYRKAAEMATARCGELEVIVFSISFQTRLIAFNTRNCLF